MLSFIMRYNRLFIIFFTAIFFSLFPVKLHADEDKDYEQGVYLLDRGEFIEALKAFGKAAKNGNSDAQYQIGIMFLEGMGMNTNPEDAAYWFRKAAQNGHAPSQYEIGNCFLKGIGVQSDTRMAAEWFRRAAEQGDPDAALQVARMYRDGVGMVKNLNKARKYYNIAVAAGLPEAKEEYEKLPATGSVNRKATAPASKNRKARK